MSLPAVLTSTTQDVIQPQLVDNVFKNNPTLRVLRTRINKSQRGGTQIVQPIIVASKSASGTYSGWGTITTTQNDCISSAVYTWGHRYATMGISRTDELANSGASKIVNLLTAEAQIAEKTLSYDMTTDLFTDSATTDGIGSLFVICGTTTVNCGGISSTDDADWAGNYDSSTSTLTLGAMITQFNACSDGDDTPDYIINNYLLFNKLWQLYEVKPDFRLASANGNLKFMGADIVCDKNSPGTTATGDNHMYFLTSKYLQFYVHPDDNFKIHEWQKPINQLGLIAPITVTAQLGCSNRRRQGMFSALYDTY